jgi:hypothetical protein
MPTAERAGSEAEWIIALFVGGLEGLTEHRFDFGAIGAAHCEL